MGGLLAADERAGGARDLGGRRVERVGRRLRDRRVRGHQRRWDARGCGGAEGSEGQGGGGEDGEWRGSGARESGKLHVWELQAILPLEIRVLLRLRDCSGRRSPRRCDSGTRSTVTAVSWRARTPWTRRQDCPSEQRVTGHRDGRPRGHHRGHHPAGACRSGDGGLPCRSHQARGMAERTAQGHCRDARRELRGDRGRRPRRPRQTRC